MDKDRVQELYDEYKGLPLTAARGEHLCERLRNMLGPTVSVSECMELGLAVSAEHQQTFIDSVPHVVALSRLLDAPRADTPTYYVSGHLDLTQAEFDAHYLPQLVGACGEDRVRFVVGDARGADRLAMEYLASVGMAAQLSIYHMFDSPRHAVPGAALHGGFSTDLARDMEMTADSNCDIAWVRPGREKSGTAKNLKRRG
jgi:hypothetical protein